MAVASNMAQVQEARREKNGARKRGKSIGKVGFVISPANAPDVKADALLLPARNRLEYPGVFGVN
jgi:hypothetical protein